MHLERCLLGMVTMVALSLAQEQCNNWCRGRKMCPSAAKLCQVSDDGAQGLYPNASFRVSFQESLGYAVSNLLVLGVSAVAGAGYNHSPALALSLTNDYLSPSIEFRNVSVALAGNEKMYAALLGMYKEMVTQQERGSCEYMEQSGAVAIPFVTAFSKGTTHGYAGLWTILLSYVTDHTLQRLPPQKLLVYENSQKGVLDIIDLFASKGFIDPTAVLRIKDSQTYCFDAMYLFPVRTHDMATQEHAATFGLDISRFVHTHFIKDRRTSQDTVAVLKVGTTTTNAGVLTGDDVKRLAQKHPGLVLLAPDILNSELEIMEGIGGCRTFVTTWGTSFFKNYVYVGNRCTSIVVYVVGEKLREQFARLTRNDVLIKRFRNAKVQYRVYNQATGQTALLAEVPESPISEKKEERMKQRRNNSSLGHS